MLINGICKSTNTNSQLAVLPSLINNAKESLASCI